MNNNSYLNSANLAFLEKYYANYLQNNSSIDDSWIELFTEINDHQDIILDNIQTISWPKNSTNSQQSLSIHDYANIKDSLRAQIIIRMFQVRGHLHANLDPLGLDNNTDHEELNPENYGFSTQDYSKTIYLGGILGFERATLAEIMYKLNHIYCQNIGYEFMHLQDIEQKSWLQANIEKCNFVPNKNDRIKAFDYLNLSVNFENFLAKKFPGVKRFSLEGAEAVIPLIELIVENQAFNGIKDVVLGMAHRGRLNVLGNVLQKPYHQIFKEFKGIISLEQNEVQGSGDVKYHLGASTNRVIAGHKVHLSLADNPSHLEAVNPIVMGKTRAKQFLDKDHDYNKVVGVLFHGDASFAGQGLVYETLCMSELDGYQTGGTVHIIINNQIGFTTSPHLSRSSPYCSDVAKGIQAPIIHVNGDSIDDVIKVAKIASDFRHKFKKDIIIDLYCYRRHGHNEIDEPSFTQPLMYKKIAQHPTVMEIYKNILCKDNVLTEEEFVEKNHAIQKLFQDSYDQNTPHLENNNQEDKLLTNGKQ